MSSRTSILITGSAGLIGNILAGALRPSYQLVGIDVRKTRRLRSVVANTMELQAIQPAFARDQVVIDLAARASVSISWEEACRHNMRSTLNVLDASRRAGVKRVIFASSNHVTGMYETDHPYSAIVSGNYDEIDPTKIPYITPEHPVRPDSPYAVGKVFGEATARYYSDAFGLSVICLRIGTVTSANRPRKTRDFATLLTHRDLVQLVECCIDAPEHIKFAIFYGVSANTWRFWEVRDAYESIGYQPRDDAETWR